MNSLPLDKKNHNQQQTKWEPLTFVSGKRLTRSEVDASWTRLAKSPIQSAMTVSDNRRCPVQENTHRDKSRRGAQEKLTITDGHKPKQGQ